MPSTLDRLPSQNGEVDTDLIEAAAEVAGLIAERADKAEELGRLPDETVEDLRRIGLMKMTLPRQLGGLQSSASTILRVTEELATGCASTSFVSTVYAGAPYLVARMSDQAQSEVFSQPDVKIINTFNPGGTATKVDGGYTLSGRWPFCTGQHHADWAAMSGLVLEGELPDLGFFVIPRSEFESADDWQVTGLAATGSATLSLPEVVVPDHRVLLLSDLMAGNTQSTVAENDPYYQAPVLAHPFASLAGVALGIARSALDIFKSRVGKRGITYTTYLRQADATITHFQMAEAQMKVDEAAFHAQRLATLADSGDGEMSLEHRAQCRADCAWTLRLCKEAVDIVQSASGGSAIHRRDPLQRIVRDMQAYSVHSLLLFATNAELYGRVLCDVDPGTPFV